MDDLKSAIQKNLTRNNLVTTGDINLATKVYGPGVGGIKVKTNRSRTTPIVRNIVEMPYIFMESHQYLTVSMEGLTVRYLKSLSTIYHEPYYRTAQYVTRAVAFVYEYCMDKLLEVYNKGGFNITEIHSDN